LLQNIYFLESHDYRDVLSRSISFFVAQRSGKLPSDQNSVDWRGDSALGDGGDVQLDLVGGFYNILSEIQYRW